MEADAGCHSKKELHLSLSFQPESPKEKKVGRTIQKSTGSLELGRGLLCPFLEPEKQARVERHA